MGLENDPHIQATDTCCCTETMMAALVTVCEPGNNLGTLAGIDERIAMLPNWL
ncbi:MAG: hypothetical protein IMY85_08640 [Chloroflexi bacterium]|jgi:hypothetical protein|nr:hypothetical protein [Chloroflexota bacterium]